MDATLEKEKQIILDAFEKFDDHWKTIVEISDLTNVDLRHVIKITNDKEFLESSRRMRDGLYLITTRKLYEKKEPFIQKFLGALTMRADWLKTIKNGEYSYTYLLLFVRVISGSLIKHRRSA